MQLKSGDLVLAAFGAVLAALYTVDAITKPGDASGWAQAALAWGFVAALAMLRTKPLFTAVLLVAGNAAWSAVWMLAPVNIGYTVWVATVPLAVFVARRFRRGPAVVAVTVAALAWSVISPFMWTWDERLVLFYRHGWDAGLMLVMHWAVVAVAYLLAANLAAEDAAAEAARQREAKAREERLLMVREEERLAIAREIHDLLGHTLTLIKVQANAGLTANQERESLEQIRAVASEALGDIRMLVRGLRGDNPDFAPTAGIAELPATLQRFREAGVQVEYQAPQHVQVPAVTGLAANRIVTEAVTNAARHQVNPQVRVTLTPLDEALEATVTSQGAIAPRTGAGIGLEGLRERAASTGGTLEVVQQGDTFTVRAVLGV
ncbi:Sensor histidine kinase DesK [Corynebacterium glaucum]|uniref:histidine kinase n=1 Tax=Corynebacterium glaucum TaxID=187491 RepID=A0A1Q2HTV9_9CORY|nr:histidine kinase [Corynebacterium glaucum]AQQ14285.1 Sensor histidine kinase DesK [Corynebacterium glaucum]